MDKPKMTKLDAVIIVIVAVCIVALIYIVKSYIATPEQTRESCWYEIKYLHMSGQEITKRVYMTCEGFHHCFFSERYKVPVMVVPFSDGNKVVIQGATDILSVAKIER